MGGNALTSQGINTKRLPASEYYNFQAKIQTHFNQLFKVWPEKILAYRSKPDFGDLDLIVDMTSLPNGWYDTLSKAWDSKGWSINKAKDESECVVSMEVHQFQIDFIHVKTLLIESAIVYYSYNDLGNLIGRLAHEMGFSFGPFGLRQVQIYRALTHKYAEIYVSQDMPKVFEFLGLDYGMWTSGFDTLENIFEFVSSSRYFNPDIYLLTNRNYRDRVRDEKRSTYTKFLGWCETNKSRLTHYPWKHKNDPEKITEYDFHSARARDTWPEFDIQKLAEVAKYLRHKTLKEIWNGNNISEWTGLTGPDLGKFMSHCKATPYFEGVTFGLDLQTIKTFVHHQYRIWSSDNGQADIN